jgi:hypothetical protein
LIRHVSFSADVSIHQILSNLQIFLCHFKRRFLFQFWLPKFAESKKRRKGKNVRAKKFRIMFTTNGLLWRRNIYFSRGNKKERKFYDLFMLLFVIFARISPHSTIYIKKFSIFSAHPPLLSKHRHEMLCWRNVLHISSVYIRNLFVEVIKKFCWEIIIFSSYTPHVLSREDNKFQILIRWAPWDFFSLFSHLFTPHGIPPHAIKLKNYETFLRRFFFVFLLSSASRRVHESKIVGNKIVCVCMILAFCYLLCGEMNSNILQFMRV